MHRALFCFGLGYSAQALARDLASAEGWRVGGTVRSRGKAEALRQDGLQTIVYDVSALDAEAEAHVADALNDATHILISVPPTESGDPVLHAWGARLAAAAPRLRWIGYLSTTGVYGDHQGAWVDEDTPATPTSARGRRRVEAEAAWASAAQRIGARLRVFRLAGLYGPGRNPLETLRRGEGRRIVKPGQVFSRIHRDDIAAALKAALAQDAAGPMARTYNLCDDEAAPPQDVTAFAAELLGVTPPPEIPYETADLSPMARSFYADNKRVRNDRIKLELGFRLKYPTYREGLRDIRAGLV
ncbi:MAG: SDR family oxidoreductase [Pseudomonadota bacterium]